MAYGSFMRAAAALMVGLLFGCAGPAKTVSKEVLFGTDRRLPATPSAAKGLLPYDERGDGLVLGRCKVMITPQGRPERPKAARTVRTDEGIVYSLDRDSVTYYDEAQYGDWTGELRRRMGEAGNSDLLVFVHGFNVRFEDAAKRTAQLAYDLDFKGTTAFFDWPSHGKLDLRDYLFDEENSQWAVAHLADFLRKLKGEARGGRIHLVSHSMGSRVVLGAMHELRGSPDKPGDGVLGEVVFAASDMDRDMFIKSVVEARAMAAHVTVYGSCADRALEVSRHLHRHARGGQAGKWLAVFPNDVDNVYVIDASWVDTGLLGHSSYGAQPVTEDMARLIADTPDPDRRPLVCKVGVGGNRYWCFANVKPSWFRFLTSCD